MGTLAFPTLDQAIAQFENVNPAYNNPGGLMAAGQPGLSGSGPTGLAQFATAAQGLAAEDALVQHYANSGYSLSDMINKWSPPSAGNPNNANYVASLATATGAAPNTPVSALASGSAASTSYPWYNPGGVFTNCYTDPNAAGCFGGATTTGLAGKITGITGPSTAGAPSAFSFGRIAAFLLGLIGIGGAVYLFKE